MFKKIVAILVVLVLAVAGFIASRPSAYRVERNRTVNAPAEVAFAQVADFHKWEGWSPWAKLDPSMKLTIEGEPGQVGSSYAWEGNEKVGAGKMTIVEVTPSSAVKIKTEFLKPMAWTSETVFAFAPVENGTTTTWSMAGQYNFVQKAFATFNDMDKMIGADFEKGLAQLDTAAAAEAKKIAEAAAAAQAAAAAAAPAPTEGAAAPAPAVVPAAATAGKPTK